MAIYDVWTRYASLNTHHPMVEVTGHEATPDRLQEVVTEFTDWAQRCGGTFQEQQLEMLRLLEGAGCRVIVASRSNLQPKNPAFVAGWAVKINS